MASPAEAIPRVRAPAFPHASGDDRPCLVEAGALRRGEIPWEIDRALAALCRERGPLRAILARIADHLVGLRAWERLGYARLSDYATERLGVSARSVRDMAVVGVSLSVRPRLEHALVSGTLGWTKVRLLARLPREEDEGGWIGYARRVTAQELSRQVRAVDRGSIEAGAVDEETARGRLFTVRCTPEVRWKWHAARGAAARAAGRMLRVPEAAELIAAEVLSALPMDSEAEDEDGSRDDQGTSWTQESEPSGEGSCSPPPEAGTVSEGSRPQPPKTGTVGQDGRAGFHTVSRPSLPPALAAFLEGLDTADAFELDARFRRALSREQRLEARIGPLLTEAWPRWVHRALGYATREAYTRERLGMDPTRARALVRLERAASRSEAFARAYRAGRLSWVKASVMEPLLSADPLGWFIEEWVAWAGRVTVRRLREDVDQAIALSETDVGAFRRTGGLPPEAREDRVIGAGRIGPEGGPREADRAIGAGRMGAGEDTRETDREIGAVQKGPEEHHGAANWETGDRPWFDRRPRLVKTAPGETCWVHFMGSADVVQLLRAILSTVRRQIEQDDGRLPTEGEALGAMLDHVLSAWGALDDKVAARQKVFARDGWLCAAPGCTSMQNLHEHHIRFRSAGGSDALENRVTLCAFHHLRGVHAGILRCTGRAPGELKWEMGVRLGGKPLLTYRSGDLQAS